MRGIPRGRWQGGCGPRCIPGGRAGHWPSGSCLGGLCAERALGVCGGVCYLIGHKVTGAPARSPTNGSASGKPGAVHQNAFRKKTLPYALTPLQKQKKFRLVSLSEPPFVLPIVVGVTGHRDILPASLLAVQNGVRATLSALRANLGPSLVLMTALAEGADQLVAEIARELDIRMIAVSPMPLELYRRTMDTAEGAAALDRLWNDDLVVERLELPLVGACEPAQQDAAQYEQLSLLLSRQSHILLALWNGYDAEPRAGRAGLERRMRGGSSHVVAMRQMGERGEVMPATIANSKLFSGLPPRLEIARSGPILHVVTPRLRDRGDACQDAEGKPQVPGTLLWWSDMPPRGPHRRSRWLHDLLWPEQPETVYTHVKAPSWRVVTAARLPAELPVAFDHIREAAERLARRAATAAVKSGNSYLCSEQDLRSAGDPPALRRLRHLFDIADADASHIQNRLFGTWLPGLPWPTRGKIQIGLLLWFALAVPFATLCFEMFTEYGRHLVWLELYLAAILVPSLVYLLVVRRGRWQGRYQDHRALAEGLRVQFFWAASGVPAAVSDNYLRHQTGMLGWIRLALRGPALDGLAAALTIRVPDAAFAQERWIKDQLAYFKRQGDLQEAASVTLKRLTRIAVVSLILIAIILLVLQQTTDSNVPSSLTERAIGLLSVTLGTMPAVAAFFVIIAEGSAYDEQAHAYAQAHDVFAEAERQARRLGPDDADEWRELLLALGQEALTENAAWIHAHRGRPVSNKVG